MRSKQVNLTCLILIMVMFLLSKPSFHLFLLLAELDFHMRLLPVDLMTQCYYQAAVVVVVEEVT